MKGKEAAAAANRRANEAANRLTALQRELSELRASTTARITELEEQVRSERADHFREAGRLASAEVTRQMAEKEKERRDRGLSDDIALHLLYRNDRFIHNACRYVSMTTGLDPATALAMVLTWRTEKDTTVLPNVDRLIELGIPTDGWVARKLKGAGSWRKTGAYRNMAISLDRAEAEKNDRIHPNYKPEWYRGDLQWEGIEVINDDAIPAGQR